MAVKEAIAWLGVFFVAPSVVFGVETARLEAGDPSAWSDTIEIITEDPCGVRSLADYKARTDAFETLRKVKGPVATKLLGGLLYFDDERPEARLIDGECFATSGWAAGVLESIVEGDPEGGEAVTEERMRRSIREMKAWWEDHAHEYGVSDPRNPFAETDSELERAIAETIAAVDPEAPGGEAEGQGATEDAERNPKEAKPSDAESERPWALLALLGALLLAAIGWLAIRFQRSG